MSPRHGSSNTCSWQQALASLFVHCQARQIRSGSPLWRDHGWRKQWIIHRGGEPASAARSLPQNISAFATRVLQSTYVCVEGERAWARIFKLLRKPGHCCVSPRKSSCKNNLIVSSLFFRGTVSQNFCFWFFSWISFPQALDYIIRVVSNFLRKFAEIFAAQGLPPVSKNLQSEKNFYGFFWTLLCSRVVCRWFRFAQLAKGKKSRP